MKQFRWKTVIFKSHVKRFSKTKSVNKVRESKRLDVPLENSRRTQLKRMALFQLKTFKASERLLY